MLFDRASRAFAMLNHEQRGFPLVERPFEELSQRYDMAALDVMRCYTSWLGHGVLSRVGGVFHQAAGGASLLAAMAIPQEDLERAARIVSDHPGVNHNYEREHVHNLWFVMTGRDAWSMETAMRDLEMQTGYPALRLPMVRPYRIDLAFDLNGQSADHTPVPSGVQTVATVGIQDRPLAALVESGLPIVECPFEQWAVQLHQTPEYIRGRLRQWLDSGVLRRFGNVVRHHELGFDCNAMTVMDLPADRVDDVGMALAQIPEVTLAYQRARVPGWNYNLYCMVHGRQRSNVEAVVHQFLNAQGIRTEPHAILFSRRRFKQTGARRFVDAAHR